MTRPYTFFTGATGLLGRYLLRDLLEAGFPVAVLARGRRGFPAADRIETVLVHWERATGRALPRPVVLKGAVDKPGLGLDRGQRDWLRQHCGRVLHSAASLKFALDPADNEPWRTNLDGTRHLVELCRDLGIAEFHHVSTAYVAGLSTGVVREDDLEVGQRWANPYEESKVAAERVVRAGGFADLTVYRPSIIVGDSVTGHSSSFHGFYTPLRVLHALAPKMPDANAAALDLLSIFDLEGPEGKNLVPVDWVSAATVRIFANRALHGRTYHLTSPKPATVREMQEAFREVLRPIIGTAPVAATTENILELAATMTEQLKVYQSYWRNDPTFDRTNTEAALPDLPCPVMDHARLVMLSRVAVDQNFGLPHERLVRADHRFADWLATDFAATRAGNGLGETPARIGLEVTGPGGGSWQCEFTQDRVAGVQPGMPNSGALTFHLSSRTLRQISEGRLETTQALESGRVCAFGSEVFDTSRLAGWLRLFVPPPAIWHGHKPSFSLRS